jgi:hypothetical protein
MILERDTSSQEKKEMGERNEGSRDKRKLMNWRLMLIVAGHAFALLLIITPALAFVIGKATDDSHFESRCMDAVILFDVSVSRQDDSRHVGRCKSGETLNLSTSVCGSLLSKYWPSDDSGTSNLLKNSNGTIDVDGRMISLKESARCNVNTIENNLALLFNFQSNLSFECFTELTLVFCSHFFIPCLESLDDVWKIDTSEECLFLQQRKCQLELQLIQQYISCVNVCLTLPPCIQMVNEEVRFKYLQRYC